MGSAWPSGGSGSLRFWDNMDVSAPILDLISHVTPCHLAQPYLGQCCCHISTTARLIGLLPCTEEAVFKQPMHSQVICHASHVCV